MASGAMGAYCAGILIIVGGCLLINKELETTLLSLPTLPALIATAWYSYKTISYTNNAPYGTSPSLLLLRSLVIPALPMLIALGLMIVAELFFA